MALSHAIRKSTLTEAQDIEICFGEALHHATRFTSPYRHWVLDHALPNTIAQSIASLPFEAPTAMTYDGRRESNNSKRVYFTPDMQNRFAAIKAFTDAFDGPALRAALKSETGALLDDALLRVEYCQDTGDFWLEPHTDISVKRFTMLIYLSDDPALSDCGTDVYDATPDHRLVHTAPYHFTGGLIFVPAHDTWHGFHRRMINGLRKSLIINYVSPAWRDRWELA